MTRLPSPDLVEVVFDRWEVLLLVEEANEARLSFDIDLVLACNGRLRDRLPDRLERIGMEDGVG